MTFPFFVHVELSPIHFSLLWIKFWCFFFLIAAHFIRMHSPLCTIEHYRLNDDIGANTQTHTHSHSLRLCVWNEFHIHLSSLNAAQQLTVIRQIILMICKRPKSLNFFFFFFFLFFEFSFSDHFFFHCQLRLLRSNFVFCCNFIYRAVRATNRQCALSLYRCRQEEEAVSKFLCECVWWNENKAISQSSHSLIIDCRSIFWSFVLRGH